MSATDYQIFINADNNTATGYQDNVFTASGANFMIENGNFYRSTGTAWGWNQITPVTLVVSKNAGVTELSINRSAFTSPSLSSTIRVAYKDIVNWTAVSKLPSSGAFPAYTMSGRRDVSEEMGSEEDQLTTLYPNPTNGNYTALKFEVPAKSIVAIRTLDLQGKEIFHTDLGVKEKGVYTHQIETSSFTKGLYIIKLQVGQNVRLFKLMHN